MLGEEEEEEMGLCVAQGETYKTVRSYMMSVLLFTS